MRVVFMGTPEFAVPSLELLAENHEVVGVYVRPDAVSGRGKQARPAPVKVVAEALGLRVLQPPTFRDPDTLRELDRLDADIVCVAAYGLILPPAVLSTARWGAVNVHASLLPRWRGAAPIQRAILAGDAELGVSIMRMEEGLDTGPYCAQESTLSDDKSAEALTGEIARMGAQLLVAALPAIAAGTATWIAQDERAATYAAKVTKDDVAPGPALSARDNVLRVRASSAAAPARVLIGGSGLTLAEAHDAGPTDGKPLGAGAVEFRGEELALGTTSGTMLVRRVKPDGKTEMSVAAWARGARLDAGSTWESAR